MGCHSLSAINLCLKHRLPSSFGLQAPLTLEEISLPAARAQPGVNTPRGLPQPQGAQVDECSCLPSFWWTVLRGKFPVIFPYLHCLQRWPQQHTLILAFSTFLSYSFWIFTPSPWSGVPNHVFEQSLCLRLAVQGNSR